MKKLLLILLCLPFIGFGQLTMIPDANFEQELIDLGYDVAPVNGSVYTALINTMTFLNVSNSNISDLTGIEDFTALTYLNCSNNQLTSLDVSSNTVLTELKCVTNQLTILDVSQNTALTSLNCGNNQLTSIDVSGATALSFLRVSENQLTILDVSTNTALTFLYCLYNQLINLDLRNGNNININYISLSENPNLFCINVDDDSYSNVNWINIDPQSYFSNNCSGTTNIEEHTTNKELLKVTDLLGRETKLTNQPLLYIYDDGTVEKRIVIE
ncbi:MAG: hypothetical protein HOD68_01045 [Flavobacteriales bacterium]|nr:hypothetical protein [Flavobacteriales bacterium]